MRGKFAYTLGIIFVLWVAFALRVWDLQNIPPGIYYDTGRILQRIWRLTAGYGLLLYFQDIAEPFDVLIRAGYHAVSGGVSLYMSQMFTVWLNVLSVASVALCGRVLYHKHPYRNLISLFAAFALATMPTAVILGKHLFRANWLPFTIALTVASLVMAWRSGKFAPAFIAGIFMGLSTSFYTGGLLFPPAMALVILLQLFVTGISWRRIQQLLMMGVGFGVAMIPWLYLFITVPDWFLRVGDLSEGASPLSNPALLLPNIQTTLSTIFLPTDLHDWRYNTFTTGFLHPIFIVLFGVGFVVSIWRWRRSWSIAPILIILVMTFPNVLSSEPYQPVRMVGTFLGLSLLVGLGAGELYRLPFKNAIGLGLFAIFLGTPLYTGYHVWYHYHQQSELINPHVPESHALKYRLGWEDLMLDIADSDTPTYLPIEYLNSDLAVVLYRPERFPEVKGYDNRPLPDGRVVIPRNDISYGFFIIDHIPVQYGLVLPETGEILILPALSTNDASDLHEDVLINGDDITNAEGWFLGQQQMLTGEHVFSDIEHIVGDVIAVYDNNLELVGIDAPLELTPNTMQPITLYWRLREQRGEDYYSRMQLWDYTDTNYASEPKSPIVGEPEFPLNIHFNIYPTVMWEAGEIVPDTRWLPIPETLPDGGYRFALAIYSYPGFVPVQSTAPMLDIWGMVGHTTNDLTPFASPADVPETGIKLGDLYHLRDYELSIPSNELATGDTFSASVTWYVEETTIQDYITFLHVLDAEGNLVAQQDMQPFGGQFPTWAFPETHDVTLTYTVTIPQDAVEPFIVRTGMYSYPDIQPLPVTDNGTVVDINAVVLE